MQEISTRRTIEQIEAEIKAHTQYVTASIIAIGNALIEAKGQLEHGEWEGWLTDRVNFSQRTANNFMRIAREIAPASSLSNMPYTKVLALLDVPADQREQVAAEVDANNRSAAALRKALSDRKKTEEAREKEAEARKKAEAERDKAQKAIQAAEHARDRAQELADQYAEKMAESENRLKAMQEQPIATVSIDPEGTDEYKAKAAEAEKLKRRAEEAERYAEEQEAAARRAQNELRRVEKEQIDHSAAADDEPYSAVSMAEAVRVFMGAMGTIPNMGAYFFGLSAAKLEAYRPHIAMVRAWVDGAEMVIRNAQAEKTGAIDISGEDDAP